VIPTDEHLKVFKKKQRKPEKHVSIAAARKSKRYREEREQELEQEGEQEREQEHEQEREQEP
jgi:hypothetical protein